MRIQHNIMAMSAYRNYTNNVSAMKKNLEKLSSGYKINRAGDDAAGLAISEKMRAQITGLETAQKNAKDGISLVQTAEGALTEVHDMLNRMVELATQSANGTYDDTTDRAQMQKEVDQLLEEINRIADSSNFNGINLLDGSLGLNKDAFGIGAGADWEVTDTAIDISELLSGPNAAKTSTHLETSSSNQANPEAIIDFGDLTITAGATTDTVTAKVNVFGKDYSISLTGKTSYGASDIASALQTAIQGTADAVKSADGTVDGTAANNDAIKIGNNVYKLAADAAGLKVTLAGTFDGTTYTAATTSPTAATNDFTEAQAAQMNKDLGFNVSVSGITGATGSTGDVVHKATQVKQAVAHVDAGKSGIDLTLNSDIVKDGNKLTIDGVEYTFKTDASKTYTGNVIDVSAEKEENWVHKAADLLSQQTVTGQDSRSWKIGVNGDGTTIHIHQTVASATGKELDTYEKLAEKIKVDGPSVTKTYNTTQITMKDATKINEGNTISIGDKKYVFTNDAAKAGTTDGKTTYVQTGSTAAQNLVDAINDGKTGNQAIAKLDSDGNIIVRGSVENEAPTILGKGLTLQIGDTSDSWNQLNVAVQDMHAKSLGIDNLKINTEESAQQAIKKIKDAINTVSDVRGTLGATQNRLDHTINNLSVMTENIQDAESTIRDVDVAEEMMAYTKNNILIQSAQAMLAQANQVPQGVLQLLQ